MRLLAAGDLAPGRHERLWDGRDDAGRRVSPGVYYARLEAEGRVLSTPVTLVRWRLDRATRPGSTPPY